jgi:hypothetical protein
MMPSTRPVRLRGGSLSPSSGGSSGGPFTLPHPQPAEDGRRRDLSMGSLV